MARDHYVPQFYLRNFQIPSKPGWVYSYQRKRRPKPIAIRTAGQEEDYYDLKRNDPTVAKDGIDKLLWMSENNSAKAISKLITASSFSLSQDEFDHLSWFIGLLTARTPFTREALLSHHVAFYNRGLKNMLKDEDEFQRLLEAYPDMDPQVLDDARKGFLEGKLNAEFVRGGETEDFLMAGQLQFAEIIVDILQKKHWTLIETKNHSRPFLTSDNPVVVMPTINHTPEMHYGYADGNLLVPLSPKRALVFREQSWGQKIGSIGEKKMAEFQFYTITQCQKSVFSHIDVEEFQRILDITEEGKIHEVTLPPVE